MENHQTEKKDNWAEYEKGKQQLSGALDGLRKRSQKHLQDKYGLSENFTTEITDEKTAMQLCERAMESLESEYVASLTTVMESMEPATVLSSLEDAEVCWQAETKIITGFDKDQKEAGFLKEMRTHAFHAIAQKLDQVCVWTKKTPSKDNIMTSLALMGTMDQILSEFGEPKDSEQRTRLRKMAATFQIRS